MATDTREGTTRGHTPLIVSLQTGEQAVREALAQIMKGLAPLDLTPEDAIAVELVLAEALNNVAEHAYPTHHAQGPIQVTCDFEHGGLNVTVADRGLGMPDGQAPKGNPQPVDLDVQDLPEGGFGWFLIRDLTRDLTYTRIGRENRLRFRMDMRSTKAG